MNLCKKCGFEVNGVLCRCHKRVWMPKCRAATFNDKRTKRNRTRSDQKRRAIQEYK